MSDKTRPRARDFGFHLTSCIPHETEEQSSWPMSEVARLINLCASVAREQCGHESGTADKNYPFQNLTPDFVDADAESFGTERYKSHHPLSSSLCPLSFLTVPLPIPLVLARPNCTKAPSRRSNPRTLTGLTVSTSG